MSLDADQVAKIVAQLRGSDCQEFELHLGEDSLVLRRADGGAGGGRLEASPGLPLPSQLPAPCRADSDAVSGTRPVEGEPPVQRARASMDGKAVAIGENAIVAPIGGIFYSSPTPGEPPFVTEGSLVQAGDAVCVIEIMKLFTTVCAERTGKVVAVHVKNGERVAEGQLLFALKLS